MSDFGGVVIKSSEEVVSAPDDNPDLVSINTYPIKDVIDILLQDKTTKTNIIWATDAYSTSCEHCKHTDHISSSTFFISKGIIIQPRIRKSLDVQQTRTRTKAEVFTPVWLCNQMNNSCDETWFGHKDIFNIVSENGSWVTNDNKIIFPSGKSWTDYIDSRRLEATCGEAPYLTSRYDATTGEYIGNASKRIGILDRKLRIVNENAVTKEEWIKWTIRAYQSCYGYEWQGDSLLIARINLLMTFFENYQQRWSADPENDLLKQIANIISWNIWQMDGLEDTVPLGKQYTPTRQMTLFDSFESIEKIQHEDMARPCKIYDWRRDNSTLFKYCKTRGKMSKLFDFVIGNPPYQMETAEYNPESSNGQTPKKNVFHHFQIAADKLSRRATVMIYPGGRWIQRSGKGLYDFGITQINDPHLSRIDFYPKSTDLFPDASLPDGITIVTKKMDKSTPGFDYAYHDDGKITTVHLNCPGEEILPLNPKDYEIDRKIHQFMKNNSLDNLHGRILPRSLFGIESDFAVKNQDIIKDYVDDSSIDFNTEIKVFTNDKAGKAGRAKWFVMKKTDVPKKELMGTWKVIVSSANAGGIKRNNQIEIVDNHSIFGRSRLALGVFPTKKEAENFYKYMNCYFVRFAFTLTDEALTTLGLKVPDLGDYTNSSIIDFNKDIDSQLFDLIDLSSEQIEYIKNNFLTEGEL